jgi:hypothetical protein
MEPKQIDESLRNLAKGKVVALAVKLFGSDTGYLIQDVKSGDDESSDAEKETFQTSIKRATLYNEATLYVNEPDDVFEKKVEGLIYQNLSPILANAYNKAKYWASHFSNDLNYPLTTGQIMRAFKDKEEFLTNDVDTDFIVRTLESVGFDLSGWNGTIAPKQDDSIVLPESGLNGNFSAPLAEKTSPAYPGYDILADIIPSNIPEGNEHYAMT